MSLLGFFICGGGSYLLLRRPRSILFLLFIAIVCGFLFGLSGLAGFVCVAILVASQPPKEAKVNTVSGSKLSS
jgi:hypothetical protein